MIGVHEMVKELTRRTKQRTRHPDDGVVYTVAAESLIDQLRTGVEPSRSAGLGGGRKPAFGPGVPIRCEAVDALGRIDKEASWWLRKLRHEDPADTTACVRRLYSLVPSLDESTAREIEDDISRWWTIARITTGWDQPAFRLSKNTCMVCGQRGGLRIKVDPNMAYCVLCEAAWDAVSVQLLGNHVRAENGDEEIAA